MGKVAQNSNFVGHSTEIIRQRKIKGPLIFRLIIDGQVSQSGSSFTIVSPKITSL